MWKVYEEFLKLLSWLLKQDFTAESKKTQHIPPVSMQIEGQIISKRTVCHGSMFLCLGTHLLCLS